MKRKEFIGNLTALGIGSLLIKNQDAKASSNADLKSSNENFSAESIITPSILHKIENEYISFSWMNDASAEIIDKKNQSTWRMGPVAIQEQDEIENNHVWVRQDRSICEQYPARFRGVMNNGVTTFTMLNTELQAVGTFKCKVTLEKEFLNFIISDIDENIPNLSFPPPIENDFLVLPQGVGRLIKESNDRKYLAWVAHLNMRFVGGLNKNNSGYIALFDENFEDSGILQLGLNLMPVWQKSLGKYTPNRTLKYAFTSGGYVGIAKKFREWAKSKGLLKSLDEKLKQTPQLKSMIGGRQVTFYQCIPKTKYSTQENQLRNSERLAKAKIEGENPPPNVVFTYKDVKEIVTELKTNWGFKNGMINLRGWIKGGYDYSHPDIWPPEPLLGSIEELKSLCKTEQNYFTLLHDNYQDIYAQNPSFPKGINLDKKGRLMKGGMWPGGQAYILNSRDSMKYAKRNWEQIKQLNTGGMFIDTTSAVQLYESYEKGNTSTKAEDLKYKIELIQFFKSKNQVFGSEEVADFAIRDIDFFENRHARKAGESIPLWPLVFHDCAMMSRYVDKSNMKLTAKPWLEDMLWGYFVLFRMGSWGKSDWKQQKEEFMASLPVDEWFSKIATAEMTNHEFLTTDFEVEKTTFSNGKSIIVNFGEDTKTVQNLTIEGLSYKILE